MIKLKIKPRWPWLILRAELKRHATGATGSKGGQFTKSGSAISVGTPFVVGTAQNAFRVMNRNRKALATAKKTKTPNPVKINQLTYDLQKSKDIFKQEQVIAKETGYRVNALGKWTNKSDKNTPYDISGFDNLGNKTVSEAHDWGEKNYRKWLDNLSPDEVEAMKDYIGFPHYQSKPGKDPKAYIKLNNSLRNDTPLSQEQEKMVKNLDSALAKNPLDKGITTFRGFQNANIHQKAMNGALSEKDFNTFYNKGFASTSIEEATATKFMDYVPKVGFQVGSSPVKLEINIPVGSKAGYMSFADTFNNPYVNHSSELLLGRGQKYRMIDYRIEELPDGRKMPRITLDLINED